ncbi:GpE family phage tail protein [Pseudovibrio brasiliensis]|uniref:GpE family phage tail protein n=1 Tax=Pseudovibrio brasiliensis TaxID=1898042 RepID=A0ABX8AZX8_9HYPH|nr:GpE family phage tail protein [Pseudovibrio brasiliensis]
MAVAYGWTPDTIENMELQEAYTWHHRALDVIKAKAQRGF